MTAVEFFCGAGGATEVLRLAFLEGERRAAWLRSETPDVYVLPNRPSFTGGGTDATAYAWFVWTPERERSEGRIRVLRSTPAKARARRPVTQLDLAGVVPAGPPPDNGVGPAADSFQTNGEANK